MAYINNNEIIFSPKINIGGSSATIKLQNKVVSIIANGNEQVTADSGYDGLSRVTVSVNVPTGSGGEIPEGYIKPDGTLDINENGTFDVTQYANVTVDVSAGVTPYTIKAGTYRIVDVPDIYADIFAEDVYHFNFISNNDEFNGIGANRADGILYFTGCVVFEHYEGDTWVDTNYQSITIDEDTEVSTEFAMWWGANTIPEKRLGNIKAKNIKAGVTILGVLGTNEASGEEFTLSGTYKITCLGDKLIECFGNQAYHIKAPHILNIDSSCVDYSYIGYDSIYCSMYSTNHTYYDAAECRWLQVDNTITFSTPVSVPEGFYNGFIQIATQQ